MNRKFSVRLNNGWPHHTADMKINLMSYCTSLGAQLDPKYTHYSSHISADETLLRAKAHLI